MRQIRVQSELCPSQLIRLICVSDVEENNSFEPGWINETTAQSGSSTIEQAFQYQSSDQLDTYSYTGDHGTYSGGGYVYELRGRLSDIQSNLSQLYQSSWIDNHTRAVIIQLTLYNPNVQLFTFVTLLTEFLSTGGIYPQASFEPINFYGINFSRFFSI
jgi:polycystin 1L2